MNIFNKISYNNLNARQQENYNYAKLAAVLADYGFNCLRISDDWNGGDFIAYHPNGQFLLIQLKGRLTIDKKYMNKEVWIGFHDRVDSCFYVYPHDEAFKFLSSRITNKSAKIWDNDYGKRHWKNTPKYAKDWLSNYKLKE